MTVCRVENIRQTALYLQTCGIQVVAATEKGAIGLSESDLVIPTAVILGSEEKGIPASILEIADQVVKIPSSGDISSLNVSVAAGIFFYEAFRQRNKKVYSVQ